MYFSILLLFFVVGTIFGSFYNVVGYRVPKGESLLYPSSHCTKCGHKLTPIELIPILSLHFLHLPPKNINDKIGINSSGLNLCIHLVQCEEGYRSDSPFGTLYPTTL